MEWVDHLIHFALSFIAQQASRTCPSMSCWQTVWEGGGEGGYVDACSQSSHRKVNTARFTRERRKEGRSERKNDGTCLSVAFTDPMTSLFLRPLPSFPPSAYAKRSPEIQSSGTLPRGKMMCNSRRAGQNQTSIVTQNLCPLNTAATHSWLPVWWRSNIAVFVLIAKKHTHKQKTPLILSALADVFHCTRTSAVVQTIHAIVQYCKTEEQFLDMTAFFLDYLPVSSGEGEKRERWLGG